MKKTIFKKKDICEVVKGTERHGLELGTTVVVMEKKGKSNPYRVAFGDTTKHITQMKGSELVKVAAMPG